MFLPQCLLEGARVMVVVGREASKNREGIKIKVIKASDWWGIYRASWVEETTLHLQD